jgi:hypothetical protein
MEAADTTSLLMTDSTASAPAGTRFIITRSLLCSMLSTTAAQLEGIQCALAGSSSAENSSPRTMTVSAPIVQQFEMQ